MLATAQRTCYLYDSMRERTLASELQGTGGTKRCAPTRASCSACNADDAISMSARVRRADAAPQKCRCDGCQPRRSSPIGGSSNAHEREADRVAASVVAGAPVNLAAHRARRGGRWGPSAGQPLSAQVRALAETRFGTDFSDVRIHDDRAAHSAAAELDADAFTTGSDVVFRANRFAPNTQPGLRLLAHELTHVVQQRVGNAPRLQLQQSSSIPSAGDPVTLTESLTVGGIQLDAGSTVLVDSWPANQPAATVYLPPPYIHAYERFRILKSYVTTDTTPTRGPEHPMSPTLRSGGEGGPNVAILQNVNSDKWRYDIETNYRRAGHTTAADAVRRCRLEGGSACRMVLTERECWDLYTGAAQQSAAGSGALTTSVVGAGMVVPGLPTTPGTPYPPTPWAPPPTPTPPQPPVPWQTPPPVQTPTPPTGVGPGAGTTAGVSRLVLAIPPAVIAAYVGLGLYDLHNYGVFQRRLIEQGYVILTPPRSICMGRCHSTTPLRPPPLDLDTTPFRPFRRFDLDMSPTPFPSEPLRPDQIPPEIIRYIRDLDTSPGPDADADATPSPDVDTTTEQDRRRRNECRETHPTALTCTSLADRDEVVALFLLSQGYDVEDLGECTHFQSVAAGVIDACDGAPGVIWHCEVKGSSRPVSVFGCLCCNADGTSSYEWRNPHWSIPYRR